MKKLIYIFVAVVLFNCNSEHASDCFQITGEIIQQDIIVAPFDRILVNRNIELIIKEGSEHKVVIETGSNLINDVIAIVSEGELILTDNNSCNYVREYAVTKVFVTSPNLTEIRSSTQYDVRSEGVLTYPNLTVLSEDYSVPDSFTNGNFKLEIDNDTFNLVFNNLSNCFISGKTNHLDITFASGTSRFEGAHLIAENVVFWNRSSNDIIVNPQQSIKGTISGTGNVITVTHPPKVDVLEPYKGRLIFK